MTLDLRTGQSRPHRKEDYITKVCAVRATENEDCPIWFQFLDRVTDANVELQAYLRRVAGYCMSGVTSEHVLFFLYGTGANGKGIFLRTLAGIWGDYAITASMDVFTECKYERHPTELARLRGARLVIAQETEKGRHWNESRIRALTGGDTITARFMRQDFFEFTPQFKLMIAGNHKPSLKTVDEANRRRIQLIPFTITIPTPERDPDLFDKLKAEWPGILRWALNGCLEWQQIGLDPPAAVRDATDKYLASQDIVGEWLEECCTLDLAYTVTKKQLYESWKSWAESRGHYPGTQRALMETIDCKCPDLKEKRASDGRSMLVGITLRPRPD